MTSTSPFGHLGTSARVALLAALALAAPRLPAQGTTAAPSRYTQADVHFVQGMIYHHVQAVVMSEWAATHGASPTVATLCKRIALSQRDEIDVMQRWLRARHLPAPDPLHAAHEHSGASHDSTGMAMPGMDMGGHSGMDMGDHSTMMPGMLTPAQMRALDAARGTAFDSLYLTGMIKHHQGALAMVATLYATPGAGQEPELSTLATDVDAGQRAEIARMQAMLNTLTASQNR